MTPGDYDAVMADALRLHAAGETLRAIVTTLGGHPSTWSRRLQAVGAARPPGQPVNRARGHPMGRKSVLSSRQADDVVRRRQAGESVYRIALDLGCHRDVVDTVLVARGLKSSPRIERRRGGNGGRDVVGADAS